MKQADIMARMAKWATRCACVALAGTSAIAAHPGTRNTPPPAVHAEQAAPANSATPVDTVTAFHAALASGDTQAALALLTEDVMIF